MRIADPYPPSVETGHLDPAAQPPRIAAVLFDFAHTTFRPIDSAEWLRRAAETAGQPLDENSITRLVGLLDEAWALPEVSRAQVGRDVSADAHRRAALTWIHAVPELTPLGGVLYEVLTATDSWLPYPDTGPVLAELARHRVPVGVVSDIAWDIRKHFASYGMQELVGAYALSYEHGLEKPDPRLFGYACAELGVDPRSVLMVGDSPARDGGAVGAGLRAYILPAERRVGVRGLTEVLTLLGVPAPGAAGMATTSPGAAGGWPPPGGATAPSPGPRQLDDPEELFGPVGGRRPPPPGPRPAPAAAPPGRAAASPAPNGVSTPRPRAESDGRTTMEFTVGPFDMGGFNGAAPQGQPQEPGFPGDPNSQNGQNSPNGPNSPAGLPSGPRQAARVPAQGVPATTAAQHPHPGMAGTATATVPQPQNQPQFQPQPQPQPQRQPSGEAAPAPAQARTGLRMRPLDPADHNAILTGIAAGWSGPAGFGGPDPWLLLPRMLLEASAPTSLVVTANEEIRGYLVGLLPGPAAGDAYVHLLGVAPGPDAPRIAQAMADRFTDLAAAANLVRVRLAVPPGDMALLGHCLAARFAIQPGGGTVAGTPVSVDYDGPGQHRVVLAREVSAAGAGPAGGRHRGR